VLYKVSSNPKHPVIPWFFTHGSLTAGTYCRVRMLETTRVRGGGRGTREPQELCDGPVGHRAAGSARALVRQKEPAGNQRGARLWRGS